MKVECRLGQIGSGRCLRPPRRLVAGQAGQAAGSRLSIVSQLANSVA